MLAGPTIATHGTDEQKAPLPARHRHRARRPGASSSASPAPAPTSPASAASAIKDGDEWIVNGQKVWTSGGQVADLGMLIARTDPDAPKHQGITYFAIDMHQPGIDVRPLREMTGRALFNEVFLDEARVPGRRHDRRPQQRLGASPTPRSCSSGPSLGAGGGSAAASLGQPGHRGRRPRAARRRLRVERRPRRRGRRHAVRRARQGARQDRPRPTARPRTRRSASSSCSSTRSARSPGSTTCASRRRCRPARTSPACPTCPSCSMSATVRLSRDVGLEIAGGLRHAPRLRRRRPRLARQATGQPFLDAASPRWRCSPRARRSTAAPTRCSATSSASASSACPRSPAPTKGTPFKDLPKNG